MIRGAKSAATDPGVARGASPPGLNGLQQDSRLLDRLYVPTRYPNGLPELTPAEAFGPEDARDAIEAAGQVVEFVGRFIEA
jgi:HEPN domain-containing protein